MGAAVVGACINDVGDAILWTSGSPTVRRGGVWTWGPKAAALMPAGVEELRSDWTQVDDAKLEALIAEASAAGAEIPART